MRLFYERVTTLLLVIFLAKLGCVCADCDFCESRNSVTCHSETVFSLCLDGHATRDYITCPPGYVCSAENFVCYPKPKASPSCARPYIVPEGHVNRCGVCNDPHKVFSCINETTIAFCFGRDEPYFHESVTVCPESTVCNLDNEFEFCSDADKVAPSCIPEEAKTTSTEVLETTKSTSSSYEDSPISVSTAKIPTAKITATTTILKKTTSSTKVSTKPTTQAASRTSKPSIASTKTINITSQATPTVETTRTTILKKTTSSTKVATKPTTKAASRTSKPSIASTKTINITSQATPTVETTRTTILKKTTSSTKVATKPTTKAASRTSKPSIVSTKTINITSQATPTVETTRTTILKKTTSSTKVSTKPTTKAASRTSKPSIVSTKTINITSQTTPATATTKISTESNRPPRTYLQLCKEMGEGFHRPDDDTTCTKFIYCYQDSKNNFVPQLDSCDNFFSATSQVCVTEKPAECA